MEKTFPKLTNPDSTPAAEALYEFLWSMKGKGILAGQQEFPSDQNHGEELRYIKEVTGQEPAILGLDYIGNDFDGVNKRAKAWHDRGGIVSICWHWGIPPYGLGYLSSKESVDLEELLTPGTELNKGFIANMDLTAAALKELQAEDVPVLWRPFHEFDGTWFWWGKAARQLLSVSGVPCMTVTSIFTALTTSSGSLDMPVKREKAIIPATTA